MLIKGSNSDSLKQEFFLAQFSLYVHIHLFIHVVMVKLALFQNKNILLASRIKIYSLFLSLIDEIVVNARILIIKTS